MSPAVQRLHSLWNEPGKLMSSSWWDELELSSWRDSYARMPYIRRELDEVIRQRLGHMGKPPQLSALAKELLHEESRLTTISLALGLWFLRGAEYLSIRIYRDALAPHLDEKTIRQLHILLPRQALFPDISANSLSDIAHQIGYVWLADSSDPVLRLLRLLAAPVQDVMPAQPLMPVLEKLVKWL